MTITEHILDTIRHADEILARCGIPTYTERCDQLAHLAEVAVRDNGELEAEIIRLEAEIFKLIGAKQVVRPPKRRTNEHKN